MPIYEPDGETLRLFLASDARVKIIQGPVGSGKTLACIMDCWRCMTEQVVQASGKRKSRILVVRDTYPKLKETTLKSWREWFPEEIFGRISGTPPFTQRIKVNDIDAEVTFVALEDETQVAFFKSYEPTMVYFNELQFIPRKLFSEATDRIGRYPRVLDGGAVRPRVIADMNAPDENHWVPMMRGDVVVPEWMSEDERRSLVKPANWQMFVQPPGLLEEQSDGQVVAYRENPAAENQKWLPKRYYLDLVGGKTKAKIDADIMNRVSPRKEGKPVFKDFRREVHVAKSPLEAIGDLELIVGVDFGRSPAAIFLQRLRMRWYAIHELIARDMGAARFAGLLRLELAQRFPGRRFRLFGDPSGDFKGQNDEQTPFMIFRAKKLPIQPAPSNLLTIRLQAVEQVLTRMDEGLPGLLISPTCTTLVAAMDGGYHYRRMATTAERYSDTPEKDEYSHPADALQYGLLAGGEGRALLTGTEERKPVVQTRKSRWPSQRRRRRAA